jgi:hypothetical protein
MILPGMNQRALIRAAQITLRRAILQNFPPGAERSAWLRWLRGAPVTEAPAELIDVRKRGGVISR